MLVRVFGGEDGGGRQLRTILLGAVKLAVGSIYACKGGKFSGDFSGCCLREMVLLWVVGDGV